MREKSLYDSSPESAYQIHPKTYFFKPVSTFACVYTAYLISPYIKYIFVGVPTH